MLQRGGISTILADPTWGYWWKIPGGGSGQTSGTIHVSPTGNDVSGDGSAGSPYATLGKAATMALAGATILLHGGTYNLTGQQLVDCNGTSVNRIAIRPAGDGVVVFDGAGGSFASGEALVRFTGSYTHWFGDGQTVLRNCSQNGVRVYDGSFVGLYRLTVHDVEKYGMLLSGLDLLVASNVLYNCVMENENWQMESGFSKAMATEARPGGSNTQRVVLRGNAIRESWGAGILAYSADHLTISRNRLYDLRIGVSLSRVQEVGVESNYIYAVSPTYYAVEGPLRGIFLTCATTAAGTLSGIDIVNNLLAGVGYGVYYYHDASNTHDDNTYSDILVANNLIYEPTLTSFRFDQVAAERPDPSNCRFGNNIVYKGANGIDVSVGDPAAWTITGPSDWPDGKPSFDTHSKSIALDPMFLNPVIGGSENGFWPLTNGPCRIGTPMTDVLRDYFDRVRPVETTTIGPIEALRPRRAKA